MRSNDIIRSGIDTLAAGILELKRLANPLRVAIIGDEDGIGALTAAVILDREDELHLFGLEEYVQKRSKTLRRHPCAITPHGHSRKLHDSYLWQLAKLAGMSDSEPARFDLVFLDGDCKFWQDAACLCLLRKLAKPGAWLIFTRPEFAYTDASNSDREQIEMEMTREQIFTPQLRLALILFVDGDPAFRRLPAEKGIVAYQFLPQDQRKEQVERLRQLFIAGCIGKLSILRPDAISGASDLNTERILALVREAGLYNLDKYLDDNPDVKAAGMDPLVHYWRFGIEEGRRINAAMPLNLH